jgi:hypothetical protein
MSNRRDHVHPPLEFTQNDRGRALARSVLGAYVAAGNLDERAAEVLSGSAPVTLLPGLPGDASVSELRDLRSMMILKELFPTDRGKRFLIRRALSEAPPSQLSAPEVNRRARAWSALTSESYPNPWNPRIGEMFQVSDVRDGIELSGRPLRDLLAVAEADEAAFEELVSYRAAHWLATFDIIDADRGSLTGQKADDDDATEATRVRRTVRNTLNALRNNSRRQAVAMLRELALAMDQGDRKPRRVSPSGERLVEPMNRTWFNREFPKETGRRSNAPKIPQARTAPQRPKANGRPESATAATSAATADQASALLTPPGTEAPAAPAAHLDRDPLGGSAAGPRPDVEEACEVINPSEASDPCGAMPSTPLPAGVVPGEEISSLEQWADELKRCVSRLLDESRLARELLSRMADRMKEENLSFVLSRGQADAIVTEIPRALRALRELPELVEGLTEP